MQRISSCASLILVCLGVSFTNVTQAQTVPAAKILPATTQGYLSIGDIDDLTEKFNATDIGQLVAQDEIEPFAKDLRAQLESKLSQSNFQFQITLDELKVVRAGETSVAMLRPAEGEYATVLLVDITGKEQLAKDLLTDIGRRLKEKGATQKEPVETGGATFTSFELPKKQFIKEAITVYYTTHKNWLVAANHTGVAHELIARINGDHKNALQDETAFIDVAKRTQANGNENLDIVWFIKPFGLIKAMRAANSKRKRGTDVAALLENQGFSAVQGIGGSLTVLASGYEIIHRTFIFAPAVKRPTGDGSKDKYNLAMRMLNFKNLEEDVLAPQKWVPQDSASYLTLTIDLKNAFEMSETLIDARIKAGTFASVMESILKENDVDIHQDIVAQLDNRVTVLTDIRLPITTTSDRWLTAIKLKENDEAAKRVTEALQKIFDAELEGSIVEHEFAGTKIWEKVPVEEIEETGFEIEIPGAIVDDSEEEEEQESITGMKAFSVAEGHVLVSNDVDYIKSVIEHEGENLEIGKDFQLVANALNKLSPSLDSMRQFARVDRVIRGTYELFRQGKMPESESPFARVLNRMLSEDEPGFVRDQELDGSKLPEDFDKFIAPYLGFAGWSMEQDKMGWRIKGCLLSKEKLKDDVEETEVSKALPSSDDQASKKQTDAKTSR